MLTDGPLMAEAGRALIGEIVTVGPCVYSLGYYSRPRFPRIQPWRSYPAVRHTHLNIQGRLPRP